MKKTVQDLANQIGARVEGDAAFDLLGIAAPERASATDLIYVDSAKNVARAAASAAVCAIAPDGVELPGKTLLRHRQPKVAFAKAAALLLDKPTIAVTGVHPTAVVADTAQIAPSAAVGPYTVVGENVRIGERTQIGPHCTLGAGSSVGADGRMHPRVTLYTDVRVGDRVEIHSGAVIGADGFGYAHGEGRHWKFPQAGKVEIGDDVEIGANATIDRGSLGRTEISRGAKIDNLVQIAHNVLIGEDSVVASQAGIAGSSTVGRHVVIGGQVGIADHCSIEDGAIVGAQGGVPSNKRLPGGRVYWGTPARPIEDLLKQYAWVARLPELVERLKALEVKSSAE